jgi:hypothetical protein
MTSYTKYIDTIVADPTVFQLRVRTINVVGVPSDWHYGEIKFDGNQDQPIDLEYLNVTVIEGIAKLEWNKISDPNLMTELRHSKDLVDATWSSGTFIRRLTHYDSSCDAKLQAGTYMMKTKNKYSFVESNNHVAAITTVKAVDGNKLQEFIEHTAFVGTHFQTEVVDEALQLAPGSFLLEISDGYTLATENGDDILVTNSYSVPESGIYGFVNYLELPAVDTISFTSKVTGEDDALEDSFDMRVVNNDAWTDFDSYGSDVEKAIQVRTQSVFGGAFTEWQQLIDGVEMSALFFEFRLLLTSPMQSTNTRITELSVTANVPDRNEREFSIQTDATGIYVVTYQKSFNRTPFVGISAHDLVGSFEVSDSTEVGFTVTFVDVNDVAIQTTFNYQATGF